PGPTATAPTRTTAGCSRTSTTRPPTARTSSSSQPTTWPATPSPRSTSRCGSPSASTGAGSRTAERSGGPARAGSGPVDRLGDGGEDLGPVPLQALGADARAACQLGQVPRPAGSDRGELLVGQHDVGGDGVGLAAGATPGPQRRLDGRGRRRLVRGEQRAVCRGAGPVPGPGRPGG